MKNQAEPNTDTLETLMSAEKHLEEFRKDTSKLKRKVLLSLCLLYLALILAFVFFAAATTMQLVVLVTGLLASFLLARKSFSCLAKTDFRSFQVFFFMSFLTCASGALLSYGLPIIIPW